MSLIFRLTKNFFFMRIVKTIYQILEENFYIIRVQRLKKVYDNEFFSQFLKIRYTFTIQAQKILKMFPDIKSCLDLGTGCGYLVEDLVKFGVDAYGVEGSISVKSFLNDEIKDRISFFNLETQLNLDKYDCVTSFEVAEHLQEKYADTFVNNCVSHSKKYIIISASPSKGGVDHFNPQPKEYWIEKFKKKDCILLEDKIDEWKSLIDLDVTELSSGRESQLPIKSKINNILIFKKVI